MATIEAIEKSMKNFSVNPSKERSGISSSLTSPSANVTLELNSNLPLPYEWEQSLDMKTGEIYYINRENGMRSNEDPRVESSFINEYYHSEEEDGDDDDEHDDDGQGYYSSDASSPCSSTITEETDLSPVLVVAGCQGCIRYFMLPKRVDECPNCESLLLHFNGLENGVV